MTESKIQHSVIWPDAMIETANWHQFQNTPADPLAPGGGNASGLGFSILWQDGPIKRDEGGTATGACIEDVLEACQERLAFFQRSDFHCEENHTALAYINGALTELYDRHYKRKRAGVLGRNEHIPSDGNGADSG